MAAETPLADVPPNVLAYLAEQKTLTLATASPAGVPHAATLVYANEGPALYYCVSPETTTARHVAENPVVAFTIDEYSPDWRRTQGVQGCGEAHVLLAPNENRHVTQLFREKFPFLADAAGSAFFADRSFYRITPSELHFIDRGAGQAAGEQPPGMLYPRSLVYSVFRGLPRAEADALMSRLRTMQVGAGEVIVRQGAPADKFFIVVQGEVEVVREEQGQSRRLATLGSGQFFGEIAILRDTPRTATVKAVGPTTLLAMERDTFQGLVAQALGTTQDFNRIIQRRLDDQGRPGMV